MPKPLLIEDFMAFSERIPMVDVRSPGEFSNGHIPGAINMPLFDNQERAKIGTLYKQAGREDAIEEGLSIVGPKMAEFVRRVKTIATNNEVLVHCWRGGMRSGSMAWLFETVGLKAYTLIGGYKSYRRHLLSHFHQPLKLVVLGGETGSGKTEILHALRDLGEQVLDLEAMAHHKGSSYGAIGQLPQPTVEHFENKLFSALKKLDVSRRIWMEDESRSIGRVFIPEGIWNQKISAPVMRIQVPFEIRVQRLVKDYGGFPKEVLREATARIQKRLGGEATREALEALDRGDLAETVRITLKYYDKAYDHPQKERKYENVKFIQVASGDPLQNAKLVLENIL